MKVASNHHSYIIAVGKSNNDNISYYFIDIEKHLMCVSTNLELIIQYSKLNNDIIISIGSNWVYVHSDSGFVFQSSQGFWFEF